MSDINEYFLGAVAAGRYDRAEHYLRLAEHDPAARAGIVGAIGPACAMLAKGGEGGGAARLFAQWARQPAWLAAVEQHLPQLEPLVGPDYLRRAALRDDDPAWFQNILTAAAPYPPWRDRVAAELGPIAREIPMRPVIGYDGDSYGGVHGPAETDARVFGVFLAAARPIPAWRHSIAGAVPGMLTAGAWHRTLDRLAKPFAEVPEWHSAAGVFLSQYFAAAGRQQMSEFDQSNSVHHDQSAALLDFAVGDALWSAVATPHIGALYGKYLQVGRLGARDLKRVAAIPVWQQAVTPFIAPLFAALGGQTAPASPYDRENAAICVELAGKTPLWAAAATYQVGLLKKSEADEHPRSVRAALRQAVAAESVPAWRDIAGCAMFARRPGQQARPWQPPRPKR